MTKSTRNLNYNDILTEIAAIQNLKEKFWNNKDTLKELKETYDGLLLLLQEFEQKDI